MADSLHDDPIRDPRIVRAIESCRPESDDLHDPALRYLAAELAVNPQLREVFGRLQRLDGALAARFQDVPVPEGLQQRLLDRLAAAQPQQVAPAASEESLPAEPPQPVQDPAPGRKRASRRRWVLAVAGALSAAAALLVATHFRLFATDDYDEQGVLAGAIQFFGEELNEPPQQGHLVQNQSPPPEYPISRAVCRVPAVEWRAIRGFLGRSGVAYDMSLGGARATLYVVARPVAGLPAMPGYRPGYTTAGCSASTWAEAGRMYVLVVHGNDDCYQRFLVRPGSLT